MLTEEAYISAAQIDKRIAAIVGELQHLEIELEMLRRLRGLAAPLRSRDDSSAVTAVRLPTGLGPRAAIVELLRQSPKLRAREIMDQLQDQVESSATDVRRCLASTLHNLTRAGIVTADDEEHMSLTNDNE